MNNDQQEKVYQLSTIYRVESTSEEDRRFNKVRLGFYRAFDGCERWCVKRLHPLYEDDAILSQYGERSIFEYFGFKSLDDLIQWFNPNHTTKDDLKAFEDSNLHIAVYRAYCLHGDKQSVLDTNQRVELIGSIPFTNKWFLSHYE